MNHVSAPETPASAAPRTGTPPARASRGEPPPPPDVRAEGRHAQSGPPEADWFWGEDAATWNPYASGGVRPSTPVRRATTPDRRGSRRRWFYLLFYGALVGSVALWWVNTPGGSVTGPADAMVAAGRITGMVGGYVLIVQVLMLSRVAWLESWVGANELLGWHRALGGAVTVVVLAHVVLTTLGYAGSSSTSPLHQGWVILTSYPKMISAFVATGILVALALLAIRAVRRRMPYELWWFLHLATYLVLLLGYGHQFADGADLQSPWARRYWLALYAFALSCLFWGRVVEPFWLNARHRLRVLSVVDEGAGMVSIYLRGRRLDRLDARAGQFFRWRFLMRGAWWQSHPFSLSAAPNAEWLRITVKAVGDHTEELRDVRPGVRVWAEGPSGEFTADRRRHDQALLIAGGSGIAPIRALLDDLPRDSVVLFRAASEQELTFRTELDALALERGVQVWYILGARNDPGPRRAFSTRGMLELVPDVRERDVYLCGPVGLIAASLKIMRRLKVPRRQIHLDPFEF